MYSPKCTLALLVAGLVGCGRFGFQDQPSQVPEDGDSGNMADDADTLLRGCAVLLHMDEATWLDHGGGTIVGPDVANACESTLIGKASGAAQPVADPVRGQVGGFDANGCIRFDDAAALRATTGVTLSAWVKLMAGANPNLNAYGILSKRVDYLVKNEYTMFLFTGARVWVDIENTGTDSNRVAGTSAIANSAWHQLTVVYDGRLPEAARVQFYVDGNPDGVGAAAKPSIAAYGSSLSVGCMLLGGTGEQGWSGLLDDVAIWTRALSPAEIASWYRTTLK